ncbi:hypothetical protein FHT07_003609 [Xanthomonas arboricola]|nr:hypothetical protein [Xanthomonas arboricola]
MRAPADPYLQLPLHGVGLSKPARPPASFTPAA